jgi:8-oxo-dGTP pyrophosphatase MutT (NUDIX family)
MEQAEETQCYIVASLQAISSEIEGSTIIDSGTKELKTINQLLQTRWNNDPSRITDYARATIVVITVSDVYHCLDALYQSPLQILEVQDNFFTPYPENYRDLSIVIKDPQNSHIGEIQINTYAMVEFKNCLGHKMFDQIRNIKAHVCLENRTFTEEELGIINSLTKSSKEGYNQAFFDSMNTAEKKERIGVYGILLDFQGRILLTQTRSGSKIVFNFPGGGVERDEGFQEALIRECEEEIGATISIERLLYTTKGVHIHEDFPDNSMFNLYYLVRTDGTIFNCQEEEGSTLLSKWFSLDEIPLAQILSVDREFVEYIKNHPEVMMKPT